MTFTFLRCGGQIDEASTSFTCKEKRKENKTPSVAQWRSQNGARPDPQSRTPTSDFHFHFRSRRGFLWMSVPTGCGVHGFWRALMGYWITGRLCHKCRVFFFSFCFCFFLALPDGVLAWPAEQLLRLTGVWRERHLNRGQTPFWRAKTESAPRRWDRTQERSVVKVG